MQFNNKQFVFYSKVNYEKWSMYIAVTEKGLCYVGSPNESLDKLANWIEVRLPNYVLIQDDEKLKSYAEELIEYLGGKRQKFSVSIDLHGTPFQQLVWSVLNKIPYGKTYSYTDIANHIEKPEAVRAIGAAIGANPVLVTIPCHRVVGKNGSLTGYRGGLAMKEMLLDLERNNK